MKKVLTLFLMFLAGSNVLGTSESTQPAHVTPIKESTVIEQVESTSLGANPTMMNSDINFDINSEKIAILKLLLLYNQAVERGEGTAFMEKLRSEMEHGEKSSPAPAVVTPVETQGYTPSMFCSVKNYLDKRLLCYFILVMLIPIAYLTASTWVPVLHNLVIKGIGDVSYGVPSFLRNIAQIVSVKVCEGSTGTPNGYFCTGLGRFLHGRDLPREPYKQTFVDGIDCTNDPKFAIGGFPLLGIQGFPLCSDLLKKAAAARVSI